MSPIHYQYVIVRSDLPAEHQVVQTAHAVIEGNKLFDPPEIHQNLVVCHVQNEKELVDFASQLSLLGINYGIFKESDMDNQYTALATELIKGKNRKIFRKLKLLKFNDLQK